jgi:hypothetical protein
VDRGVWYVFIDEVHERHTADKSENVTSVLFLVSLADYNASIIEDRGKLLYCIGHETYADVQTQTV